MSELHDASHLKIKKWLVLHRGRHGRDNSIGMFVDPVYRVDLDRLQYYACRGCTHLICRRCLKVDRRNNAVLHQNCDFRNR